MSIIQAPVYIPTDEEFRANGILSLTEAVRKHLQVDAIKMPLFKIRSPNWFRDHFVVNNETLRFSTFKNTKLRETTYETVIDGIVATKTGDVLHRLQEKHFVNVVNAIDEIQHNVTDVDYRQYFSEQTLNNHGRTNYMENINGSFIDTIYRKHAQTLTAGYSLNGADKRLKVLIPDRIPGVNRSMLCIAEPSIYAPWQINDVAMMSINYHVAGWAKIWLGMDSDDMFYINDLVRDNYRDCITPMLHRDILTTIEMLEDHNCPYVYTIQQPGDYVVTMPMGWHCVANAGCNLSEAVNVYCDGWPVVAGRQNYCECNNRGTTYNDDAWNTLFEWIDVGERQMVAELADENVDIEALELSEDRTDLIPDYRERSLTYSEDDDDNNDDDDSGDNSDDQMAETAQPSTVYLNRYSLRSARGRQKKTTTSSSTSAAVQFSPDIFDNSNEGTENHDVQKARHLNTAVHNDVHSPRRDKTVNQLQSRKEKIEKIKKNKEIYVNSAAARRKARLKQDLKKAQQKKEGKAVVYQRSPVAIYFRNKIRTSKRALKNIDMKISNYHASVDTDSYQLPERLTRERAAHVDDAEHLTKRRDLYNVMLKIWGYEKIGSCIGKGHTELTILRDYFNNEDDVNIEYFKECMDVVPISNKTFWEELLADKDAWKRYFGVDERYRIPHKVWQKLFPQKKK